jgi:hypothetical protein
VPNITLQITPDGPLCDAFVGVSQARHDALTTVGQPIPPVVRMRALIDTGASCTCVDPSVLKRLAITPTGSIPVSSPTTGATPHTKDQYDISLLIPHPKGQSLTYETIPVVEVELLQAQGFHALIGRDVLKDCVLVYHGDAGFYSLSY